MASSGNSLDDLRLRLAGYKEKAAKLDGLLASDPQNDAFLSLRARLRTAVAEVESAIASASMAPAPQRPAPHPAAGSGAGAGASAVPAAAGGSSAYASGAAAAAAAAAAAPKVRSAVVSAASALVRAPLSGSSAVLHGGGGAGGGAGSAAAASARPAFRLVEPVGGAKRTRAEAGGEGQAEGEEEEGPKGQYANLHIPDNLKLHLTDVSGAAGLGSSIQGPFPHRSHITPSRTCPFTTRLTDGGAKAAQVEKDQGAQAAAPTKGQRGDGAECCQQLGSLPGRQALRRARTLSTATLPKHTPLLVRECMEKKLLSTGFFAHCKKK